MFVKEFHGFQRYRVQDKTLNTGRNHFLVFRRFFSPWFSFHEILGILGILEILGTRKKSFLGL